MLNRYDSLNSMFPLPRFESGYDRAVVAIWELCSTPPTPKPGRKTASSTTNSPKAVLSEGHWGPFGSRLGSETLERPSDGKDDLRVGVVGI
jgi:hypothetical protein